MKICTVLNPALSHKTDSSCHNVVAKTCFPSDDVVNKFLANGGLFLFGVLSFLFFVGSKVIDNTSQNYLRKLLKSFKQFLVSSSP